MEEEAPAVGIDLGTTYSCIAYYSNDVVTIIRNEFDKTVTPSYVSFSETDRIVGDDAKNRATLDIHNTIFGVKYIIGRYSDDDEVSTAKSVFPYKIVSINGKPRVSVQSGMEKREFAPEEISSMVLQKLKDIASEHFKKKVTKAVITVPAHFNDAQRQATKNAGRIAGLQVLKIINEPTAAALAFGIDKKYSSNASERTILVYDFGGGTFDVSVIVIRDGIFEVKATNGLSYLGGDNIDVNLCSYFAKKFKEMNAVDVTTNQKLMRKLRQQCEKVKKELSFTNTTVIQIDCFYGDKDLEYKINKKTFEEINEGVIQKTIKCVAETLNEAKIRKESIDEILLVGGSTRIPGVRKSLQNFFNGKELNAALNPDEAVAMGAAIEAAILDGQKSNKIQAMLLLDVCPLSLGIQIQGGIMSVIIPRNTQVPVTQTRNYKTTKDNQTIAKITVYEGEGTFVKRNFKLGEFTVLDLPKAPQGKIAFDVTFSVDSDGILEVTASTIDNGKEAKLKVRSNNGHLTESEIQKMIDDANKFRLEDEKKKHLIQKKIELQRYCNEIERLFRDKKRNDKKTVLDKCSKIQKWLDDPKLHDMKDYVKKTKELDSIKKSLEN